MQSVADNSVVKNLMIMLLRWTFTIFRQSDAEWGWVQAGDKQGRDDWDQHSDSSAVIPEMIGIFYLQALMPCVPICIERRTCPTAGSYVSYSSC